jgi:hypothetical protein
MTLGFVHVPMGDRHFLLEWKKDPDVGGGLHGTFELGICTDANRQRSPRIRQSVSHLRLPIAS